MSQLKGSSTAQYTREEWKYISGYGEDYEISSIGRVFSLKRNIYLKQISNRKGYLYVNLYKDGVQDKQLVARLVASHFIPNPEHYLVVNHKDENKINNDVCNLEWCTNAYNIEYSLAKNWQVITPENEVILVYNLRKFCIENNLNDGAMYLVAQGVRSHHKGYKVKEVTDDREVTSELIPE